jgi:hypothetical protein
MPSIVVRLQGLDFGDIEVNLGKVRAAIEAGEQLGTDGLDPLALLGDLSPVIKAVQDLDVDENVLRQAAKSAIEAIGDLIGLPDLPDLDGVITGIATLVDLISQMVTVLSTDGATGTDLVDRVLTTAGGAFGLTELVDDITTRAAQALGVQVPDQLTGPLRALERLGAGGQLDAAALAGLLGDIVVGLDLDLVRELVTTAGNAVAVVTGAGDTARVETAIAAVAARVDATYATLTVGGSLMVDVNAALAEIQEIGTALDALHAVELPRFVDGIATDLRTVHNALSELDITAAVNRLHELLPLPGEDIPRIMVDSLGQLADTIDELTGEALTEALAQAGTGLRDAIGVNQFGDLLTGIDEAFDLLGREVDRLPLGALRDMLVDALVAAQQRILAFDGFDFLDEIVAPVRDLEAQIRGLDLSTITDAVQGVVDTINETFADFPVGELRDAVDAVLGPLGEIVEDLTPFVQEVATQLDALAKQLEAVDFEAAGAATLDLMSGIRDQVRDAVSGDDVPEPVKVMIAGAAAVLRQLDLAAELTAPFDDAIVSIDVDALLEPVEEVWQVAGDALRRATPAALIAELDPPFQKLLDRIDDLSLQPLIGALGGLFDDLVDKLQILDPRTLVAPLEREFQALLGKLRAALDPAPLFAPLREAYAGLRGLLDQVDVEAVIKGVVTGLLGVPDGLTQSIGDRLKTGGTAPAIPAPAGQFRFGDVLRPIGAFVAEIRDRLGKLGRQVLGAALAQLAGAIRGLRSVVDSDTGFAVQLADALDARLRLVDPHAGAGPLAELRTSLESLAAAVPTIQVDAAARAQLTTATASVQFDARVQVELSADLTTQVGRVRARTESTDLGRATRLLVRSLDAALPAELLGPGLDPAAALDEFLDAVFARIDPTSLAAELDAIGDRIQARFVVLADELTSGIFRLWNDVFSAFDAFRPDKLIGRVQAGLDGLFDRLDVLDPAVVENEARNVVAAAVSLLGLHSPARLAAELGTVFDAAMDRVRELDPEVLLGDLDPFAELKTQLAQLRPSVVFAPLVEQAAGFTAALETIADIDLGFLGEVVARIQATFATVLDGVEAEWNSLLDELGRISGGVSVSVTVG